MTSEPWAHTAGFGDPQLPNVAPGWLAAAQRAEAAERAREQREADEHAARAQDRRDLWLWQRAQQMAFRGEPFDLSRPETLMRSREQLAAEVFARQDAEAARSERRALIEAGVLHDLGPAYPSPIPGALLEPASGSATRADRVPLLEAPDTTSPAIRARNALRRWRARERRQRVEKR